MSEGVTLKQIQATLSTIEKKVSAILSIEKKNKLLNQLKEEDAISDWSVKLIRMDRKGRLDTLKAKGLI